MTAWLVVPDPRDWLEVEVNVPSAGSVPHSNQPFVANPFGFTLPLSTPPTVVTDVAGFVATVGGRMVVP